MQDLEFWHLCYKDVIIANPTIAAVKHLGT